MSELDLPVGIQEEDLRFVNPNSFPIWMCSLGWAVELDCNADNNPAKTALTLFRPVSNDFNLDDLDALTTRMGINDEINGGFKPGYSLLIDSFNEMEFQGRTLRHALNPHEDDSRVLIFNFTGFSTQETMDAIIGLKDAFMEPVSNRKKFLSWMLGKIGLRD